MEIFLIYNFIPKIKYKTLHNSSEESDLKRWDKIKVSYDLNINLNVLFKYLGKSAQIKPK